MTNKKCIVPEKSVKVQKAGYEEIHIPAPVPKPMEAGERLVPISMLPFWAQLAFDGTSSLNRVQSKLYEYAFEGDDNFLLCAPTGAGKTNVALLAILRELGKYISSTQNDSNNNVRQKLFHNSKRVKVVFRSLFLRNRTRN